MPDPAVYHSCRYIHRQPTLWHFACRTRPGMPDALPGVVLAYSLNHISDNQESSVWTQNTSFGNRGVEYAFVGVTGRKRRMFSLPLARATAFLFNSPKLRFSRG